VRHANVVALLHARLDAPPYYLVMPRLGGAPLATLIAEHTSLPVAQSLRIARHVAEGLSAIDHSCGMIHGDVKPSNIFVSNDGRATLLDLGFARTRCETTAAAPRRLCGSLAYAAPETLTSALTADVRSDIYSLGATLYEMLCGRRPFDAAQPGRLVERIRSGRATCLRELMPAIPRAVASLVHRMLAKEPLRRPQYYSELVDELIRLEINCFAGM
jgi:serine/threonine-protein kinase